MKNNALKMNDNDNVVILITPLKTGDPIIIKDKVVCNAAQDIDMAHKVACLPINNEGQVIRFGQPIIVANRNIQVGEWVHLHNTKPLPTEIH